MRSRIAVALLASTAGLWPAVASSAPPKQRVIVTNTPGTAVPVAVTVNEPVQAVAVVGSGLLTGPMNSVLYTVPAGKRLVVEHFSSEVGIATTTSVNRFSLGVAPNPSAPGGVRFSHYIPPSFSAPCGTCAPGQVEVVASQPVRMYVEAGEALVVNITFSGPVGPNAFSFYSVSGYLVDAP